MSGIWSIIFQNLGGIDCVIIGMAIFNVIIYVRILIKIDKVYEHFNARDQFVNLNHEAQAAFRSNTKAIKKIITAEELLKFRSDTNRLYALYVNITSMFPLMGMLGTVWSLIPMVNMMGSETTGAFFSALTSTFWGIVCALVFKALDSTISYKIDDNEKHMECYFNPTKV